MKILIPGPEIISDLLTENWELRWQVLELFYRIQLSLRHHTPASKEHRQFSQLEKKLHATLNGPHDRNLELIMTAAYFLGGNSSIFRLFNHFEIDDSREFYPELKSIKRKIIHGEGGCSFFDYFHSLTGAAHGVERTTAIAATLAIRLFSPEKALRLIIGIVDPELRSTSLRLLHETWPEQRLNDLIFADNFALLKQVPELIVFIRPPLSSEEAEQCNIRTLELLTRKVTLEPSIAAAIGRLKLTKCRDRLNKFTDNNYILCTLSARMGDTKQQTELLAAGNSWRRKHRLAAIPGIAFIPTPEAVELLQKRASRGDRHERHLAWAALSTNCHPQALKVLFDDLMTTETSPERRLLLSLLARHPRAEPDQANANRLSRWHDQEELYPELLEALSIFGYGKEWESIIRTYRAPLLHHHQQQVALFLTRFADRYAVRRTLIDLLDDVDWCFSFKLLNRLKPYFTAKEFKILLSRLASYENSRELTIKERLSKGDDLPNFSTALAEFLNRNQETATTIINRFIAELIEGRLPAEDKLQADFAEEAEELQKLFLDQDDFTEADLRNRLPLLHILNRLRQTEVDGSCALATVVHRSRRYSGYLRQTISDLLVSIINQDRRFQSVEALPDLQDTVEYIRHRPGYDTLRETVLQRMAAISRQAKDLRIYTETAQNRSLKLISSRRISEIK